MEKWPFLDQSHGLTPLEKCQFFDFMKLLFFRLKRCGFAQEYRKRHFRGLYFQKKKLEKWPFLDQSQGLTPLEKCQFFDFMKLLFFRLKRCGFAQEYRKRHFRGLYFQNKTVGKMAIFGRKPWINPLGKRSNFRLFKLLVFLV